MNSPVFQKMKCLAIIETFTLYNKLTDYTTNDISGDLN